MPVMAPNTATTAVLCSLAGCPAWLRSWQPVRCKLRLDPVLSQKPKSRTDEPTPANDVDVEAEVAYLAKRHKVSAAIVRELMRISGSTERAAIEREIEKGRSRR